jgi:tetrapyrrole methylase family protein/MazG family protein
LFAAVNVGRFANSDPEMALTNATNKFIARFEKMEKLAKEKGKELDELSIDEMDKLWNEIKNK